VISSVPQGLVLHLALFHIFINDLDEGIVSTFSKSANDTKLEGVADTPEGCATTQQVLDSLESWSGRNLMKLSKCRILHLERNICLHRLEGGLL